MGPHHDDTGSVAREPLQRTTEQILTDDEIGLLDESLRLVGDRSDRVIGYFYAALFVEAPHLRALFPAAMDTQRDRLFAR
jgi:hemoglobin-like flavoprotein